MSVPRPTICHLSNENENHTCDLTCALVKELLSSEQVFNVDDSNEVNNIVNSAGQLTQSNTCELNQTCDFLNGYSQPSLLEQRGETSMFLNTEESLFEYFSRNVEKHSLPLLTNNLSGHYPTNNCIKTNTISLDGIRRLTSSREVVSVGSSSGVNENVNLFSTPEGLSNGDTIPATSHRTLQDPEEQIMFLLTVPNPTNLNPYHSHEKLVQFYFSNCAEIPLKFKSLSFVTSTVLISCNPGFTKCNKKKPTRLSVFVKDEITIHLPLPQDQNLVNYFFQNYSVELMSILQVNCYEFYEEDLDFTVVEFKKTLASQAKINVENNTATIVVPIKRDNSTKRKKRKEAKKTVKVEESERQCKGEKKISFVQIVDFEGNLLGRSECFWSRSKSRIEMEKKKGKKSRGDNNDNNSVTPAE
ncbi:hypothetical protein ABK040_012648 [Willaertia magna]